MKGIIRRVVEVAGFPMRSVSFFVARRIAFRETVHGIEILDALSLGQPGSPFLPKVVAALNLIARVDPALLLRLRRYVRAVWVTQTGPGFEPSNRVCVLSYHDLDRLSTERIGLQLAHEAAHARLYHAGFRYHVTIRSRVEAVCVGAEIRLARRLAESESLLEETAQKLAKPWWSDKEISDRREAMWKEVGVSRWMLKWRRRLLG